MSATAEAKAKATTGSTTIQPTPGRIVYGFTRKTAGLDHEGPFPCLVIDTKDLAGMTCVCVAKFDRLGSVTWHDVPLFDAGMGAAMGLTRWCEWMPYQMEKAAKLESAS